MKVLWTISNWKHTGPVQPSLDLARAFAREGHDVRVEVGVPPATHQPEAEVMRDERGLPRADAGLRLHKHAFVPRDLPDAWRLARWLRRERPDVVVATLANDHRIALGASRRAGGPPVVRLFFSDGEGRVPPRERRALLATPAIVTFGDAAAVQLGDLGVDASRVHRLGAPLDVEGLRALAPPRAEARERVEVPANRFLVGIVARLQRHRRYELLWDAAAALRERGLPFHVLVLGRGTHAEEVGHAAVRARGIGKNVTFGGYLKGRAYATHLAALDAQLLLVPGSDPTCRALREGMALGVPSLATRRGLLPSIVEDGRTGLLFDETVEGLTGAVERLAADPEAARRMGEAAAASAETRYGANRVAAGLREVLAPLVQA